MGGKLSRWSLPGGFAIASLAILMATALPVPSAPAFAEMPYSNPMPSARAMAGATAIETAGSTETIEPTGTVEPTGTLEPTGTPAPTGTVEPTGTPAPDTSWMKRYRGHKVGRIKTKRRMVALTFDDGPNSRTRRFVKVLDKYGARGTFFATWWCSKKKGMASANRYVLKHGHELANHTKRHKALTGSYSYDVREIMGIERMLIKQTGQKTTWVRAMGGMVDKTGLKATKKTGHLYAQWSIDSLDSHQRYTSPGRIYHNVVDHVRKGDVILLHVTHRESLAALPRILKRLRKLGFKMVTLSQLAAHGRP